MLKLIPKRKIEQGKTDGLDALVKHLLESAVSPNVRTILANDANAGLLITQAGSGHTLELSSGTPELRFTESDQTDPAGRFRFKGSAGYLILEAAATASWATDTDVFTVGGSPTIFTVNTSLFCTLIRGATIAPDTTTAGDQMVLGAYVGASIRNLLASENVASGNILGILGSSSAPAELRGANSVYIETDDVNGQFLDLRAYDVDGAAYTTLLRLTAGNTPTITITAPIINGTVTTTGLTMPGFTLAGNLKYNAESTGAGVTALSSNCPAVDATAIHTWLTVTAPDGDTIYLPAWK